MKIAIIGHFDDPRIIQAKVRLAIEYPGHEIVVIDNINDVPPECKFSADPKSVFQLKALPKFEEPHILDIRKEKNPGHIRPFKFHK